MHEAKPTRRPPRRFYLPSPAGQKPRLPALNGTLSTLRPGWCVVCRPSRLTDNLAEMGQRRRTRRRCSLDASAEHRRGAAAHQATRWSSPRDITAAELIEPRESAGTGRVALDLATLAFQPRDVQRADDVPLLPDGMDQDVVCDHRRCDAIRLMLTLLPARGLQLEIGQVPDDAGGAGLQTLDQRGRSCQRVTAAASATARRPPGDLDEMCCAVTF